MIVYFDSSALVKKYALESGTQDVVSIWNGATEIFTSAVTYAEIMAAFYRKRHDGSLSEKILRGLARAFQSDWEGLFRVEVTDALHPAIDRLLASHVLRGFDAIHLASAVLVHEKLPENFLFACFDSRLNRAAQEEGLNTVGGPGPSQLGKKVRSTPCLSSGRW